MAASVRRFDRRGCMVAPDDGFQQLSGIPREKEIDDERHDADRTDHDGSTLGAGIQNAASGHGLKTIAQ